VKTAHRLQVKEGTPAPNCTVKGRHGVGKHPMTTAKLVVAALMLPVLILAAICAAAGVIVHRLHT